jgi:hypothetical protein
MHYNLDNIIRTAIANRNIIEFSYHGYDRIAEPHIYGVYNGRKQILVYQIGGQSASGGLPNWRKINVDEIYSIQITPQNFYGPRSFPSGEHSSFDEILAVVTIRDEVAE